MAEIENEVTVVTETKAPTSVNRSIAERIGETLACNSLTRNALPAIGGVLGGISAGALATPETTPVGGVITGIAVGSAVAASTKMSLQCYCDRKYDFPEILTSAAGGGAAGAGATIIAMPAKAVGTTIGSLLRSPVAAEISSGVVEGVAAGLAQNGTTQAIEVATGRREDFDGLEFVKAGALGGMVGGVMKPVITRAFNGPKMSPDTREEFPPAGVRDKTLSTTAPNLMSRDVLNEGGYTFLHRVFRTHFQSNREPMIINTGEMHLAYEWKPGHATFMDGITVRKGLTTSQAFANFKEVASKFRVDQAFQEGGISVPKK